MGIICSSVRLAWFRPFVGFSPLDTLRGGLESGLDSFRLVHWSKRAFWIRGMALRGKSWVSLFGCIDGADGSLYFLFAFLRCGALHGTRIGWKIKILEYWQKEKGAFLFCT
jgi:hypothetical protein